jgi:hypothetical protein
MLGVVWMIERMIKSLPIASRMQADTALGGATLLEA